MKCARIGCSEPVHPLNGKYCSREHAPFSYLLGIRKPNKNPSKVYRLVNGDPVKLAKLQEAAAHGMSLSEAAKALGYPIQTARKYKQRFKIPLQDGRRAASLKSWAKRKASSAHPESR